MSRPVALLFGIVAAETFILGGSIVSAADRSDAQVEAKTLQKRPYFKLIREVLEEPAVSANRNKKDARVKAELKQSDAWLDVRSWLDDYYAVQVEYSEREIADFEHKLSRMSAAELRLFLTKFNRAQGHRMNRQEASEDLRAKSLDFARRSRQEPSTREIVPRQWHFQTGVAQPELPQRRPRRAVVQPPLITSREVARIAVLRQFWHWW
jgi:hypothetical protein